ncbi:MAG: hypothetical protein AAB561_00870 [Patescibacteria group bacterium]
MLNNEQQALAEKLGILLADSALPEMIKEAIIQNLYKIPDDKVAELVRVLETEQGKLNSLVADLQKFFQVQKSSWAETEKKQSSVAADLEQEIVKELSSEVTQ